MVDVEFTSWHSFLRTLAGMSLTTNYGSYGITRHYGRLMKILTNRFGVVCFMCVDTQHVHHCSSEVVNLYVIYK